MKRSIGQKATKTGSLLVGMRDPRIAALLEPYGFNQEALKEGWRLFMDVTGQRLDRVLSRPVKKSDVVTELDQFEDRWFYIVKAVLERHYPEASQELFRNLHRSDGKEAAVGVAHFIERLNAMEKGEEPYGEKGREVREYLRTRGLTDELIEKVSHLVARLQDVRETKEPIVQFDDVAYQVAEEAMWAWYLEWSKIGRHIIRDGNLLRALGFKKRHVPRRRSNDAVVITSEKALPAADNAAVKALPAHEAVEANAERAA